MSFDGVARIYEPGEYLVFGRALQRCRLACLPDAGSLTGRTLVLGEGDGRFLEAFLQRNPNLVVDCVEASPAMIATAQARLSKSHPNWRDRVEFLCADARDWTPKPGNYNLLVSHFFFDCFGQEETAALVRKFGAAARPGAAWLIAEFDVPARGPARWRARLWISALYWFFRAASGITPRKLPRLGPLLREAGFLLQEERRSSAGLLVSQKWILAPQLSSERRSIHITSTTATPTRCI